MYHTFNNKKTNQPNLTEKNGTTHLAWLVTANMGYGHIRAIYPLKKIACQKMIMVGEHNSTSSSERLLWQRLLTIYELLSRAKGVPLIGNYLFQILNFFLHIPEFYPYRDLSKSTFQTKLLVSSIKKGLCKGMTQRIKNSPLPLLTSFYAPAIAADLSGHRKIYCIICDTDLNRVWVNNDPWESNIEYLVPCGRAATRLKAYGVPENRIHLTGFPLPTDLLGGPELETLKRNLGQRLHYLDPNKRFWSLHKRNIEYFLGKENSKFDNSRLLTITYAVGGAGAQSEIGMKIADSLQDKIRTNQIRLNLVAGTRSEIIKKYLDVKTKYESENIQVIYGNTISEYFERFNNVLHTTDILWSKPSELSFYCGLGIPVIMTPTIGSQEKFNKRWLQEIQAGIKQEKPEYTNQWLFDLINKGRLAEAAWSGFLKARKKGTYQIVHVLKHGHMQISNDLLK